MRTRAALKSLSANEVSRRDSVTRKASDDSGNPKKQVRFNAPPSKGVEGAGVAYRRKMMEQLRLKAENDQTPQPTPEIPAVQVTPMRRAPVYCLCDKRETGPANPRMACEGCNDWHMLTCLGVTSMEEARSRQSKCICCRKDDLWTKLREGILAGYRAPGKKQISTVCFKLGLGVEGDQTDMLVRVCVFLLTSADVRQLLIEAPTALEVLQVAGHSVQRLKGLSPLQALESMGTSLLAKTCRECRLVCKASKAEMAANLLAFLTGQQKPKHMAKSTRTGETDRKRAKAKRRTDDENMSPSKHMPLNALRGAEASAAIKSQLQTFSVRQLRAECGGNKLPVSGNKATLVQRLAAYLVTQGRAKGRRGKVHEEGCSCAVCDLELSILTSNMEDMHMAT